MGDYRKDTQEGQQLIGGKNLHGKWVQVTGRETGKTEEDGKHDPKAAEEGMNR